MQNEYGIEVWGIRRVALWIFSKPREHFFPGVMKFSQRGLTCYRFLLTLVGGMTSEEYLRQLGGGGFAMKYRLLIFSTEGSGIIEFEGAGGFTGGLPRIVFAGGEAHLEVPASSLGGRDWDDIAVSLASLFGKPNEGA